MFNAYVQKAVALLDILEQRGTAIACVEDSRVCSAKNETKSISLLAAKRMNENGMDQIY
jgi:hypothetical protein